MANPNNPISVGVSATDILTEPAMEVALWLPDDATQDVTVVVTWDNDFSETTTLEVGGPGLAFRGRGERGTRYVKAITGTVASGTQDVHRAVLQPW